MTDECLASAAAADGGYACDYAVDELYKAASAGLEAKNKVAFDFLSKFQLTTEQQSEIAGYDRPRRHVGRRCRDEVGRPPTPTSSPPGSADPRFELRLALRTRMGSANAKR